MKRAALGIVAVIALGACSSDSDAEPATTPRASTTEAAPATAASTTVAPTTSAAPPTTECSRGDSERRNEKSDGAYEVWKCSTAGVWEHTSTAPATTAPPTAPPTTSAMIREGTYVVGSEFAPGTYRVAGYWARRDAEQEIIDNDLVDDCTSIMIVLETDAFVEIRGAALPIEESLPADPTECTDGTFLVGMDIQPGQYRIQPVNGSSYWARRDATLDIIDNDLADGPTIVKVREGDFALSFQGRLEPMSG